MAKTLRARRSRPAAIKEATAGTAEGTSDIVAAVIKESTGVPAWRPVRESALMAMAAVDPPKDQVWMTTNEFEYFLGEHFQPNTKRAANLASFLGIGKRRRAAMLAGARITKVEAMACAHYATGQLVPLMVGSVALFEAWITKSFGAAKPLADALGVADSYILDRMKGYAFTRGQRVERVPDVTIIRAIDWVWRVGPFSPYGHRLRAAPNT